MTFQKMLSCLFMARGRNNDPGIATVRAIAEAAQPRLMRVESAQRDIAEAILVSFPFLRTVFDKTLLKRFKEKQLCKSHGFLMLIT